jgi:Ca2+-binding RTX toxin-like protein
MPLTLTQDFAQVTLGPVTLMNNTWGVDTWGFDHWVNGQDYWQTVTYNPGDLTTGVAFNWSYTNPGGNIIAYPEIILGYKPWDRAGDPFLVGRVSSLKELKVTTDIDIRGDTDGFNIAYDLWLTDVPQGDHTTIKSEVMIWLHPGGFDLSDATTERISLPGGSSALVYHEANMDAGTDQSWKYTAVILDGAPLDGTVDLNHILQILADRGYINRQHYLSAVELGAEVQTGTGGFTLNSFDWTHATYRNTAGADSLTGTASDDRIYGLAGDDRLSGVAGQDRLYGDAGADTLYGGAGRDVLRGGLGADLLNGGLDADRFVFATTAETAGDRITGFSRAQGDKIDLRSIDANALTSAANDAFQFIGNAVFSGNAGELRMIRTTTGTTVQGDITGDGRADFSLVLLGVTTLTADAFFL